MRTRARLGTVLDVSSTRVDRGGGVLTLARAPFLSAPHPSRTRPPRVARPESFGRGTHSPVSPAGGPWGGSGGRVPANHCVLRRPLHLALSGTPGPSQGPARPLGLNGQVAECLGFGRKRPARLPAADTSRAVPAVFAVRSLRSPSPELRGLLGPPSRTLGGPALRRVMSSFSAPTHQVPVAPPLAVTTKNVPRCCQGTLLGGRLHPCENVAA